MTTPIDIDQVLQSSLRMVRSSWKVSVCLFLQLDDEGVLRVRAADGLPQDRWERFSLKPKDCLVARAMEKNQVLESDSGIPWDRGFKQLLETQHSSQDRKFSVIPIAGQYRTLGALILGPFPLDQDLKGVEMELRSAGALCAVLSAHLRMYEWVSEMSSRFNFALRTPLTAVQGSVGMVLGGLFGDVGSDVKTMMEMARRGCEKTVEAIEAFLDQQNPTGR